MTIQNNYPAIKPSLNLDFANTKQLDPRITYSRASTGTYYDGKTVAKAEENLLAQSQGFTTFPWEGTAAITANSAVAPDGTTTAALVTGTNTVDYKQQPTGVIATGALTYTYSVYFKAGTSSVVRLYIYGNTPSEAFYDLTAVTATPVIAGTPCTASIVSVGNGWFRCSITAAVTGGLAIKTVIYTTNGTYYVWGAQLEQRSFATAYTPTTTAPITNYIPVLQTASAGTPRFDHNPITGESLGLLIEEQRTNLLTYSQDFDNPNWSKTRASVIANAILAPDGTIGADKAVEDTSTGTHVVAQSVTLGNGLYTASISIKAAERTFALFQMSDLSTGGALVFVNLTTGSVVSSTVTGSWTSVSGTVINQGNGWYRVNVTGTKGAGTVVSVQVLPSTDGTTTSYTGNGFSGVYIWGAQLEAGAFATSYIPTVASQVTRAADSASMTGTNFSSWYNQGEGSIYQDLTSLGVNAVDRYSLIISATGSAGANSHNIRNYNGVQVAQSLVNSTVQGEVTLPPAVVAGVPIRLIYAYKTNDFAGVKNGGSIVVDTAGLVPTNLTRLDLPGDSCNHLKKLSYYPRRLTNTQLQSLTT